MYNDPYRSTFRRTYNEDEDLEDRLANKASQLKQITISLGNELKESNKILSGLDDDMEKTRGFLGSTIGRVLRIGRSGGTCKIYTTLVLFCFFVFFVLYVIIKWNS
jgi:blocked-early-in-transport protein 1